jgi:hypothetical protein
MDAGARLLVQPCHTRPLDFTDFAIPDNALEGTLEHFLKTHDNRAHSVPLELLGALESRGDNHLAILLIEFLSQNTFPSLK